jgi:hypothetical protein
MLGFFMSERHGRRESKQSFAFWNRLRQLARGGRSVTAVLQQIEKALAERERDAA